MLQRVLMIILLAAVAIVPVQAKAGPVAPTIAIVDLEKIMSESKAGVSLQKQIAAKREAFQKEFADKDKGLKTAQAELIGAKEKLTAEEFNNKRKAFDEKVSGVKSLFEKRRNGLQTGVDKAMGELRKNIMESAAKVAEDKGYDIVLSRDSVVIVDKGLDITPDVLKTLDDKLGDISHKVE